MSKKSKYFLSILANSNILQWFASRFIIFLPLPITHNLSKYILINKIIYTIYIDQIKGDYTEFGCFTGSCLKHASRCIKKYNLDRKIFGFDSFKGFPEEVHKEFKSEFFKSDYYSIKKLEKKFSNIEIVKGYFSESLNSNNIKDKVKKISFSFIDCDLAISAKDVFKFISDRQTNGSFIMIDDFYNLDTNNNSIREEFFKYFNLNKNVFLHSNFGIGGVCFRYFKTKNN